MVEAGVDLVIGHHSHCAQSHEMIDGRAVFYGLGNFVMPDLCVKFDATATGREPTVFRKRQMPWNQRSVVVRWDPRTGVTTFRGARFHRGRLSDAPPPRASTSGRQLEFSDRAFRVAERKARWRARLTYIAADPIRALPILLQNGVRRLAAHRER